MLICCGKINRKTACKARCLLKGVNTRFMFLLGFVAVVGGFVGLKSDDSDVNDVSFIGAKYVGTFVPVVPVLLESPIYSANASCFAIVKSVVLLYDLSVKYWGRKNVGTTNENLRGFKEWLCFY